jgi:hypothetical protein
MIAFQIKGSEAKVMKTNKNRPQVYLVHYPQSIRSLDIEPTGPRVSMEYVPTRGLRVSASFKPKINPLTSLKTIKL